jgi:hypothetical protein
VELLASETGGNTQFSLGNAHWGTNTRPSLRGRVQPSGSRLSVDMPHLAAGGQVAAAGKQGAKGSGEGAAPPHGDGEGDAHGSVLVRAKASVN